MNRPALSKRTGRSLAGVEPFQLRRCEGRFEQERRLLEASEHLGDEMHAVGEICPVDSSGFPRAVTRRIDPIKEFAKLGENDLPKGRRETSAEILAELEVDGGPELDGHQVASQDASNEPLLLDNERVDGEIKRRASPDQSGDPQAQPEKPPRIREQCLDDAIPHVARINCGRVESLRDLGLEAGLLMEGDLEVGEQDELRAGYRVDFEARPMVTSERLAQVPLPVRRFARCEALHEPGEGIRFGRHVTAAFDLEARELAADLLEHPEVAPGNGGARSIQRSCRIDDPPNGRE